MRNVMLMVTALLVTSVGCQNCKNCGWGGGCGPNGCAANGMPTSNAYVGKPQTSTGMASNGMSNKSMQPSSTMQTTTTTYPSQMPMPTTVGAQDPGMQPIMTR